MFYKDKRGKTAIDYARENLHYQTFKILIEFLLINKSEHLYSKIMIDNIAYMVQEQSD